MTNQDAVREAGGIRPLIHLLAGSTESDAMKWAARTLIHLSRENATNRNLICEQSGTIARLVALLGAGASSEAAHLSAEILRCLMLGQDDRVAVSVLAAMKRQGVGLGENARFTLSDAFPGLLEGLTSVVSARLSAATKRGADSRSNDARSQIQLALNDAIALELPEEQLEAARARLDAIAAARAEAIAARRLRKANAAKESAAQREATVAAAAAAAASSSNAEASNSNSAPETKERPTGESNDSAPVSHAQAMLLEAQNRLREIEAEAAAAKRARKEAAANRKPGTKKLTLKAATKAISAVAAFKNLARKSEAHDLHDEADDEFHDLDDPHAAFS